MEIIEKFAIGWNFPLFIDRLYSIVNFFIFYKCCIQFGNHVKGFVYKHKLMSFDFIVMASVVHTCVKYTKLKIVHELFDRMTENELKFSWKVVF
ncbi:hypothetical protein JHK82_046076 [Glycine max]|uniref:Uncharacterized protein n=2 Tax=Glycine subgen. Soja TaxID=1462606 RepID=A0A0R0FUD8_SOYBN|nr:hypothetical protein JHK82_046076 [Glycine max]KAH1149992.1 hypothetical protein GYH30_044154 [Glycine max]KRH06802.1 hypothetical protein GLYMA_16G047000v4 [Glycine max]RZB98985.1 hypothetical protein D0Y65_021738 [Glycine soja]